MGIGIDREVVVFERLLLKGEDVKKGQLLSLKNGKLVKATLTDKEYHGVAISDEEAVGGDKKIQFIYSGYIHGRELVIDTTIENDATAKGSLLNDLRKLGIHIMEDK